MAVYTLSAKHSWSLTIFTGSASLALSSSLATLLKPSHTSLQRLWTVFHLCWKLPLITCFYPCVFALSGVYDSLWLWTVACQAPLSMGFSRPEKYWSRLPFPFPGDLPDPGIKPSSHMSPMLQPDFYHWATREAPFVWMEPSLIILQGLPQIHFLSKTFPVPFIPRLWTPNTQFRVGHRFGSLTVCLIYSLCVCVCVCVGMWVCVPIFWHLEGT